MADVQFWKDTIIGEIEQIRAISSSIPNKQDDLERTTAIDSAEEKIRSAKSNCRALKSEIRIVADPEESSRYRKELSNFEQTLQQLSTEIQGYKSEESRNRLFLGADTNGGVNGNLSPEEADPTKAGNALLTGAERIQDKTQVALSNTVTLIAESKVTGMTTLEELERQRNQINNIDDNVVRLEDNLNRADKLIKTFGKRMATDKLIQAFACLNILLIVGVVVYSIVKGGTNANADEGAPESPVETTSNARMLRGTWD